MTSHTAKSGPGTEGQGGLLPPSHILSSPLPTPSPPSAQTLHPRTLLAALMGPLAPWPWLPSHLSASSLLTSLPFLTTPLHTCSSLSLPFFSQLPLLSLVPLTNHILPALEPDSKPIGRWPSEAWRRIWGEGLGASSTDTYLLVNVPIAMIALPVCKGSAAMLDEGSPPRKPEKGDLGSQGSGFLASGQGQQTKTGSLLLSTLLLTWPFFPALTAPPLLPIIHSPPFPASFM